MRSQLGLLLSLSILLAGVNAIDLSSQMSSISGTFDNLMSGLGQSVQSATSGISSLANNVANTAKDAVGTAKDTIANAKSTIQDALSGASTQISNANETMSTTGTKIGTVAGTLTNVTNTTTNKFSSFWKKEYADKLHSAGQVLLSATGFDAKYTAPKTELANYVVNVQTAPNITEMINLARKHLSLEEAATFFDQMASYANKNNL